MRTTDEAREYNKSWRQKNPVKYLLHQAKYRAKRRGVEFDIKAEDIDVPLVCPIYNIELKFSDSSRDDNSYSIDRVDNTKGYVKGNVRVISWKANQRKGDLSVEEAETLLNYMKGKL